MIEHVAVDMDDVVVDFVGGLVNAVNTEYGAGLTLEDIDQWDLHPILDPIIGQSFWKWMRDREWLWANFGVIPGALGGLEKMRREGRYLELVTSKPQWAEHNVWKWLGKWRPPFQRVTIVGPDENKAHASDAELLIDDKPQNCLDFIMAGRAAILFDRPHNRSLSGPRPGARAMGWADVPRMIQELEEVL